MILDGTINGLAYDPREEATLLGANIIVGCPELYVNKSVKHIHENKLLGLTIWEKDLIILAPGLTPIMRRSVLAHEVEHYRVGDMPTRDRRLYRLQEGRADSQAIKRLIRFEELLDIVRLTQDGGHWWRELKVKPQYLETYINGLSTEYRDELSRVYLEAHDCTP